MPGTLKFIINEHAYINTQASMLVYYGVQSNSTKNLTEIWHQFWNKNDDENIEIIFKSHQPRRVTN